MSTPQRYDKPGDAEMRPGAQGNWVKWNEIEQVLDTADRLREWKKDHERILDASNQLFRAARATIAHLLPDPETGQEGICRRSSISSGALASRGAYGITRGSSLSSCWIKSPPRPPPEWRKRNQNQHDNMPENQKPCNQYKCSACGGESWQHSEAPVLNSLWCGSKNVTADLIRVTKPSATSATTPMPEQPNNTLQARYDEILSRLANSLQQNAEIYNKVITTLRHGADDEIWPPGTDPIDALISHYQHLQESCAAARTQCRCAFCHEVYEIADSGISKHMIACEKHPIHQLKEERDLAFESVDHKQKVIDGYKTRITDLENEVFNMDMEKLKLQQENDWKQLYQDVRSMMETRRDTGIDASPMTPRAKQVLGLAQKKSKELNHSYLGAEHIIAALAAVYPENRQVASISHAQQDDVSDRNFLDALRATQKAESLESQLNKANARIAEQEGSIRKLVSLVGKLAKGTPVTLEFRTPEEYEGYGWIKVPKFTDDLSAPTEQRLLALSNHHKAETLFLVKEVRTLAGKLLAVAQAKTGTLKASGLPNTQPGSNVPRCKMCDRLMAESENCGGDCTYCLAECGDPECIDSAVRKLKDQMPEKLRNRVAAGHFYGFNRMTPEGITVIEIGLTRQAFNDLGVLIQRTVVNLELPPAGKTLCPSSGMPECRTESTVPPKPQRPPRTTPHFLIGMSVGNPPNTQYLTDFVVEMQSRPELCCVCFKDSGNGRYNIGRPDWLPCCKECYDSGDLAQVLSCGRLNGLIGKDLPFPEWARQ